MCREGCFNPYFKMTSLSPQAVVWVTRTLIYFEEAGVTGTVGAVAVEEFGVKGSVFSPTLPLHHGC